MLGSIHGEKLLIAPASGSTVAADYDGCRQRRHYRLHRPIKPFPHSKDAEAASRVQLNCSSSWPLSEATWRKVASSAKWAANIIAHIKLIGRLGSRPELDLIARD